MARKATSTTAAKVGYEAQLWQMADALRNNMDTAEYKHAELDAKKAQSADPEDPDEYRTASIFWVPKEARWQHLKANAPQPAIGTLVDDAMESPR